MTEPSSGSKAAAVVFGALVGIPMSLAMLGLVSILFPPALLTAPLAAIVGWRMAYNAILGRPHDA